MKTFEYLLNNGYVDLLAKEEKTMDNDQVNHPSHYTFGNIECIDAIESSMNQDEFRGYLKGCILKYIWRYENKEKPLQDLAKAQWYLNKLIDSWKKYSVPDKRDVFQESIDKGGIAKDD